MGLAVMSGSQISGCLSEMNIQTVWDHLHHLMFKILFAVATRQIYIVPVKTNEAEIQSRYFCLVNLSL